MSNGDYLHLPPSAWREAFTVSAIETLSGSASIGLSRTAQTAQRGNEASAKDAFSSCPLQANSERERAREAVLTHCSERR